MSVSDEHFSRNVGVH